MADVLNVVAKLKLTSKGKLQYGDKINQEDLSSDISKLCISPFTSRNLSRVKYKGDDSLNSTPEKYMNYFTTRKNVDDTTKTKVEEKINDAKKNKETKNESYVLPEQFDTTLMDLRNIEEDYREQAKSMKEKRFYDYYMNLQQFDLEHVKSIEAIEKDFIIKQNEEVKQLDEDQNRTSEELAYYQAIKEEREFIASEKLKQAELHRKEIELKIKKDYAIKEEKIKKKKTLASMAEPGLKILNIVTQIFVEKTKENKCEEFKVIMDHVNKENTDLRNIVTQGINSNSLDELDTKIKEAKERLVSLDNLLNQTKELSKKMEEKALLEQKEKEEEERKRKEKLEKEALAAKEESEKAAAQPAPNIPPPNTNINIESKLPISTVPALAPIESMLKPMLQLCAPPHMFQEYLRLSKLIIDTETSYEGLNKSTAKDKKTYKFDLYKVINTSINAISDESARHLMDKIARLTTLLSGNEVVNGGKKVSTRQDPHALSLSKDLIAKKLVLQGPTQVASSHKAAFPIAAVVLGIWTQFPDVGKLIMGHFFSKCPYTVPFYIPKTKEISTVDYCKLVGYSVEGEEVESEDKYLKKLSGLIRLYAAIISSDVPLLLGNRSHPLGLEHGWLWLTSVLNLEPRPVTSVLLFNFLEVAGHALMKKYGKQFRKLLQLLCEDMMPKILEVTPNESKAGAMRLKIFLETCIKEGRIRQPEGYLTSGFYNSHR